MSEVNYKRLLENTFRELSKKYLDKWQSSTSKTCFSLILEKDAIYICNYMDGNNVKNISLYTIDDKGNPGNNTIINEKEDPELYETIMPYYEQIRKQVKSNKIENISALLHRESI